MKKVKTDARVIKDANIILGALYEQVVNYDLPVFGSDMLSHHNFSAETAAITTQRSRIQSKFFEPSESGEKLLRKQCFKDWIKYEEQLRAARFYCRDKLGRRTVYKSEWWGNLSSDVKAVLFKARDVLHQLYGRFSIDLHNCEVDFTPGETSWSSGGHVSVLSKLKFRSNWEVTAEAFEDFCRLSYHNASLKRAAKAHFDPMTKEELRVLTRTHKCSGYLIFRSRFEKMVTITYGSVGDSVFKNLEKRRFINKEPMGNMLLQRVASAKLRHSLKKDWNNDLESGQQKHRDLIQYRLSTIDFSNASDSIHMDLVFFLFPSSLRKYLLRWRSEFVLLKDSWHMPDKLCSMGNGFCFEILTLTLLAVSRALDAKSSVYGDDVIISNDTASVFVKAMEAVGFKVNEKKSFISSDFRESCGAFYYEGVGYLTTFDIHWCETMEDVIINHNKIKKILAKLPPGVWCDDFLETLRELQVVIPTLLMGPSTEQLDSWANVDNYAKRHKRDADVRALRLKLIEDTWLALEQYHIDVSDVSVVSRTKFTANVLTKMKEHVTCPFQLGFYMHSGRKAVERIRGNPKGKTPEKRRGSWSSSSYFVLPTGHSLSIKALKQFQQEMLVSLMIMRKVSQSNCVSAVVPL